MSKLRWSLLLGISFAVISLFTYFTFNYAANEHCDPYYLLGAQTGLWVVVIGVTLFFYLIAKKLKRDFPSFLRWLGVTTLSFIPLTCIMLLQALPSSKAKSPFAIYPFDVCEFFIMGIALILIPVGIKGNKAMPSEKGLG